MKARKIIFALVLLAATTGSAWAGPHGHGHGHFHSRVFIGFGPYWGPGWFYPPPEHYYQPPVVYSPPPVYIEQNTGSSAGNYWYYCADAKRYYPYVKDCPGGWQQVAPTPPDPR